MRVTKKVENYIREQVKAKIMPKYEWEKAEAKRIRELAHDIENRASEAAVAAAKAVYDEAKAHSDVLEYDEKHLNVPISVVPVLLLRKTLVISLLFISGTLVWQKK